MNRKAYEKVDYLRLLLAIIGLAALILLFDALGPNKFGEDFKEFIIQVIPDLASILIAFIIAYLILNWKGYSPQEKLREDLVQDLAKVISDPKLPPETHNLSEALHYLNMKLPFLHSEPSFKEFNFNVKLEGVKQLDIIAYSGVYLFQNFQDKFAEAVSNGARLRIMLIDPDSQASELLASNQYFAENPGDTRKSIERIRQIWKDATKKLENFKTKRKRGGSIELRLINWIPSLSLIIVDRDSKNAELKVKVNSLYVDTPPFSTPNKIINKQFSPVWFDYFVTQYEKVWEQGVSLESPP
ncbi:MAG: hypothetical protein H6566_04700 [Lewinellaceae bacterium]|nr:hypothetical protein [Lewinellaceae bacterium]